MSHPPRIHVPEAELAWRFSRSSGPGGQHVNVTDTRVELLWSLRDTTVLTEAQKTRAAEVLRSRLVDGRLAIVSSQYRSQHRNREAARVRLEELLARAVVPPKVRRPTRPGRGATERRLAGKKRRADLKQSRRRDWD